jgi:hypothetical protein
MPTQRVFQTTRELPQWLFFRLPGHDRHLPAPGTMSTVLRGDPGLHDMQARRLGRGGARCGGTR